MTKKRKHNIFTFLFIFFKYTFALITGFFVCSADNDVFKNCICTIFIVNLLSLSSAEPCNYEGEMCATPTAARVSGLLQIHITYTETRTRRIGHISGIYQRLNNWLRLVVRWPLPLSLALFPQPISIFNPVPDALREPLPRPLATFPAPHAPHAL